jgi:hypothetical protein
MHKRGKRKRVIQSESEDSNEEIKATSSGWADSLRPPEGDTESSEESLKAKSPRDRRKRARRLIVVSGSEAEESDRKPAQPVIVLSDSGADGSDRGADNSEISTNKPTKRRLRRPSRRRQSVSSQQDSALAALARSRKHQKRPTRFRSSSSSSEEEAAGNDESFEPDERDNHSSEESRSVSDSKEAVDADKSASVTASSDASDNSVPRKLRRLSRGSAAKKSPRNARTKYQLRSEHVVYRQKVRPLCVAADNVRQAIDSSPSMTTLTVCLLVV